MFGLWLLASLGGGNTDYIRPVYSGTHLLYKVKHKELSARKHTGLKSSRESILSDEVIRSLSRSSLPGAGTLEHFAIARLGKSCYHR